VDEMIIHGVQTSKVITPLLVDSAGRVIISASDPSSIIPGELLQAYEKLNLALGANTLDMFTVPAGQRWQVTMTALYYTGTVAGVVIQPFIKLGTTYYYYADVRGITTNQIYTQYPNCVIDAGTILGAYVGAGAVNDDIHFVLFGFRIK
jgi:hypothetical protein